LSNFLLHCSRDDSDVAFFSQSKVVN